MEELPDEAALADPGTPTSVRACTERLLQTSLEGIDQRLTFALPADERRRTWRRRVSPARGDRSQRLPARDRLDLALHA